MELDEAAVFIIDFIPLRKVASWCFIIIRLKYKKTIYENWTNTVMRDL